MTNEQKKFLDYMNDQLKEMVETRQSDSILAVLLKDVGLHQATVKGEFMFLDEDCDTETPSGLLQAYFSVAEYRLNDYIHLSMRLIELNSKVNIGQFCLCKDPVHIYYRCSIPLVDLNDLDSCAQLVFVTLTKMTANLNFLYNYLTIIADDADAYTLEEYDAQMRDLLNAIEEDPDYIEKLENGTL